MLKLMSDRAKFIQNQLSPDLMRIKRGLEKESLRVTSNGTISHRPHPAELGKSLTHPFITTDFSESLLEFITPPFENYKDPLSFLWAVHHFSYEQIGDELLWPSSMPCYIEKDDDVPIAEYGTSHMAKMKSIYRKGLSYRYGRKMQAIAGIHYNFSLPYNFWKGLHQLEQSDDDLQHYISQNYFHLLRNFYRNAWILIYLFGASPAMCTSFLKDQKDWANNHLKLLGDNTYYHPYATALRMSELGYQSTAQENLKISLNDIDEHVRDLSRAIRTTYPPYSKIGIKDEKGNYKQLNNSILQIENEYYGLIRPKRTIFSGERPTLALERRGVEYLEVRCLDLNPLLPLGMSEDQLRFIDLFLVTCLVLEGTPFTDKEEKNVHERIRRVVWKGRQKNVKLPKGADEIPMSDLWQQFKDVAIIVAKWFDDGEKNNLYESVLRKYDALFEDAELTPSGIILNSMQDQNTSYFHWILDRANSYKNIIKNENQHKVFLNQIKEEVPLSNCRQQEREKQDSESDQTFEQYLANYFN